MANPFLPELIHLQESSCPLARVHFTRDIVCIRSTLIFIELMVSHSVMSVTTWKSVELTSCTLIDSNFGGKLKSPVACSFPKCPPPSAQISLTTRNLSSSRLVADVSKLTPCSRTLVRRSTCLSILSYSLYRMRGVFTSFSCVQCAMCDASFSFQTIQCDNI